MNTQTATDQALLAYMDRFGVYEDTEALCRACFIGQTDLPNPRNEDGTFDRTLAHAFGLWLSDHWRKPLDGIDDSHPAAIFFDWAEWAEHCIVIGLIVVVERDGSLFVFSHPNDLP